MHVDKLSLLQDLCEALVLCNTFGVYNHQKDLLENNLPKEKKKGVDVPLIFLVLLREQWQCFVLLTIAFYCMDL